LINNLSGSGDCNSGNGPIFDIRLNLAGNNKKRLYACFCYPSLLQTITVMGTKKQNDVSVLSAPEYFLQQHEACKKGLHSYKQKKDNDLLHKLRVAIKKGNAVLNMLYKLEPSFDYDKAYQPYKIIFKSAGLIREEILQRERLKDASKNKVIKKPADVLKNLNQDFFKISSMQLKNADEALPEIKASLESVKHQKIKSYCKKLSQKLKSKWKKNSNEGEIHKFRKSLKQLLYCAHLLSEKERKKLISDKEHKRIDKLQDDIGQWHDNILLLNKISGEEIKVSVQFLQSIQDETKDLLKEIHRKGDKL
jgi:hypothetical protein